MPQKAQVIQLVSEFKERSRRKFKEVVAQMDSTPDVTMTMGVFQSKFRRFPERHTLYEAREITALIQAFTDQGEIVCTPFEAILLCAWTGISVSAEVKELFKEDDFNVAMRVFMEASKEQILWSDPIVRNRILKLLEEESNSIQKLDWSAFLDDQPSGHTTPYLTVGDTQSEKPEFTEYEKFERYDHREIASLIKQAAKDVNTGQILGAEDFLTKYLHKANPQHSAQIRDANHNLGVIHIKRGNYAVADEYLRAAFDRTSSSDSAPRARILGDMGANAFAQGLYTEAQKKYLQGLEIVDGSETYNVAMFLQNSMGVVAFELQQYDKAYHYYEQTRAMAWESKNIERLAYAYKGMASVSEIRNNFEYSKRLYSTGLGYADQIGHTELFIQFSWLIGVLQTQRDQRLKGEGNLKVAATVAADNNLSSLYMRIFISLGRFYIQEHKWDLATDVYLETLEKAIQIQNHELIAKSMYGLALISLAQKHIIGTNDVIETIRSLSFLLKNQAFHSVPVGTFNGEFLEKAQSDFQLGLLNFPNLQRYQIVKAFQILFSGEER